MNYIYLDDDLLPGDKPVFMVNNKSFRYGDGLFETMKLFNEKIILGSYHFERFFTSLRLMQFEIPGFLSANKLAEQIHHLCKKNNCNTLGRIRLSAFRGDGSINDRKNVLHYIIECQPADHVVNEFNEDGLVLSLYPNAMKTCDQFSNIKSANFLPYVMAAQYAKQNNLDDCLVLNTHARIADATIANVFLISNKKIITPPLSEGCINGVMRRYLLEKFSHEGYEVEEKITTQSDIEKADEVFLTNAMFGIRWVKQFNSISYTNSQTGKIYQKIVKPLWATDESNE